MKRMGLFFFIVVSWLSWAHTDGLAETMYVTDRLYLSLRQAPDPDLPALTLLPSDTEVDVLATQGQWAQVKLTDGRSGWVMKRFLVNKVPKSTIIEELEQKIANKEAMLEKLESEIASLKERLSESGTLRASEAALKNKIASLRNELLQQKNQVEVSTKQQTVEKLRDVYLTGIVALFAGLFVGYFVWRPRKKRQTFSPYL
jgi:SH3 domain protein